MLVASEDVEVALKSSVPNIGGFDSLELYLHGQRTVEHVEQERKNY